MNVVEPCAGDGAIASHFPQCRAYDIDPAYGHPVADARTAQYEQPVDAFITNPPFAHAMEILRNLHRQAPCVVMLLRLSFLEPTYDRGPYLAAIPPRTIVVVPRISFTGDGRTDTVTCAWMIWDKQPFCIVVEPRSER